jgi:hypothetical protein
MCNKSNIHHLFVFIMPPQHIYAQLF